MDRLNVPVGNNLQALVTGCMIGAIMQASGDWLHVDVVPDMDHLGNFLPTFTVTGRESGETVRVTVDVI